MRKLLLVAAIAGSSAMLVNAETKYYAADAATVFGLMKGVSANGRYAAVADEEDNFAHLWCIDNPAVFTTVGENARLYGVTDDGMGVGATYNTGGKYRAAIYRNGEWSPLPGSDDEFVLMNEQYAVCVTADGKVISGYEFDRDANAERGGRYYPVAWKLNEATGEYEIIRFNDLKLPEQQGFIAQCMTPDGRYIGGRLYCGFSSMIPAIVDIDNHVMKYWNELETRYEPWEFRGKYFAGYDADGKQIWVADKDDPSVWLYAEQYIDGLHNENDYTSFNGEFLGVDTEGNIYGYRTVATYVAEDGQSGNLASGACVYNIAEDEFTDFTDITAFSLGYDNATKIFATGAKVVVIDNDGVAKQEELTKNLGFSTSDDISAVTHGSADGKVLGGIYGIFNPAKQAPDYHPFVIVLDNPLSGISEIAIDHGSDVMILVADGRIEVANAKNVAVYDLGGKLVSTAASSSVEAGIYVVNADTVSKKVVVK